MAVTLKVTGNGHFQGAATNLESYSVSEDSTPIEASDNSGGTGSMDFNVVEDPAGDGTILLLNDTVELEDGSNGRTQAIVKTVSGNDGIATVTADSRLNLLMTNKQAAPFTGALGNALLYYFGLASLTTGIVIDAGVGARTVTYQGFDGNLWDALKAICIHQQIEISLVSSNIVVRPIRTRIAEVNRDATRSWQVSNIDLAQNIEIYYYGNTRKVNQIVYPKNGWNEDITVYQVDAGQTLEVDIPVEVSLESLQQPQVVTSVGRFDVSTSQYAVAGSDGLPIPPAQWTGTGGSLVATINPDTKSIHVVITASTLSQYAPYRIAMSAGPSDYYSSLRILGTGVHFEATKLTIPTGVPADKSAVSVGVTVDNPYITTYDEAFSLGVATAQRWASPSQTVSATATVINRKGDKGTANAATFAQFDADNVGKTFAQFDTTWTGKTYAELDAYYTALVQDNFENQAFGNVAGARVKFRDAWYRIRSASINQENIQYTAERDTTFADFSAAWAGKTFAQFDARWVGKTYADFGVIPLWT